MTDSSNSDTLRAPAHAGTQTGHEFLKAKAAFEKLGVWDEGYPPKQWHYAAIASLNVLDGNGGMDAERAKFDFILAKALDDGIDQIVRSNRDLVNESKGNTQKMGNLQTVMIVVTILYVVVSAIGVYMASHIPAPTIQVQPATLQVIQAPSAPNVPTTRGRN